MRNYSTFKKLSKGFISLLLVFTVMASLAVPFNISVLAEEEPAATGDDIHAFVYKALDSNGNVIKLGSHDKYELIFKSGATPPYPERDYEMHVENFDNDQQTEKSLGISDKGYKQPWYDYNYYVHRLIIMDRIRPRKMSGWFMYTKTLSDENVSGLEDKIDTSICESFYCTFNYARLKNLDLRNWNMSSATTVNGMFSHQEGNGLKTLNISSPNWEMPNCTNFGAFIYDSVLEELDLSYLNPVKATTISGFLEENKKLKKVTFGSNFSMSSTSSDLTLSNAFRNDIALEELDLSSWHINKANSCKEMFKGCSSLKSINFGDNTWGAYRNETKKTCSDYTSMFEGCTALETLDAKCISGALNSPLIFKGCSALKELDLSSVGTANPLSTATLSGKDNIFEGCDELAWIRLNANWPQNGKAGTSMPSKTTWKKIDDPNKDLKRPNDELFLNFSSSYVGTWVADSNINFKGNGGTPSFQLVSGNKGVQLDFDENEVVASRNGYDFAGWYTDKDGGTRFRSGNIPDQWSYYAHWNEHHYTLKLNGNGGTTVKNNETVTEYIADSSLGYDDFYELSNTFFTKEGSVLSSWNTRPNGTGTSFSANDSVDKLTEADGGEVTLYAQWHTPDVVVSFNSHGGTPVDDKYYTLQTGQTVTYGDLSETTRSADAESVGGYTFLGWYTENGIRIESSTEVTESCTLHARWQKNASVTFDANGGYFDNNTSKTSTTKICKPGRTLGVTPEPEHASATFEGWYTDASGGTEISSATPVNNDVIYYAHWGYKPKFETNGGTFTSYNASLYQSQSTPQYTITALPTIAKDHGDFKGWFFNGTKLNGGETIDLSGSNIIEARWDDKTKYTLKLYKNDGTTSKSTINVFDGQPVGAFPIISRSGYDFEGWYPNADGTGTELKATDTVSSSGDYYAKWSQRDITLTFDPDGGTMFDDNTMKVASGKTIPSFPGANRAAYYLDGWYTEKNGGGTKLTLDTTITENKTYYANWKVREIKQGIYKYSIGWSQNSNTTLTNTGETLSLHPTIGDEMSANLHLLFEIDSKAVAENVSKMLPVGAVTITFPKSLFTEDGVVKDRNNILSFPSNTNFSYSEVGDNYVFTNKVELHAGDNIEFTFTCKVYPRDIKGGYIDQNGYYQGDYYQKTFTPTIVVNDVADPLNYSRTLNLEAHTKVICDAAKTRTNVVNEWNTAWGEKPADADEYFYVIWELESNGSATSSQKYKYSWSEETAHDGTVIYSSPALGTQSALITNGKNFATVVTKHLKKNVAGELTTITNEAISSVEWASGYIENKRVLASTKVYIPVDGGLGSSVSKTVYDSDTNFNPYKTEYHYRNGGQEKILAEEEVVMPYEIKYAESKNENSPAWNHVTEKYTAAKRDYVLTDGAKGDAVISTMKGTASYNWGNSDDKALNDSDYYFDNLRITLEENDAVCLGDVWSTPELHTTYSDYDDIELWIRTEGSDTFKIYKTLSGVSTATIDLPDNTVGYQIKHSSEFYTTKLNVKADLHLKASNRVLSLVKNDVSTGKATLIKNKALLSLTTVKNNESVTTSYDTSNAEGWLASYELNIGTSSLYTAKACSNKEANMVVNSANSTETIPVMIAGWGYNNSGNKKLMKSGVFYDLLPPEFSVDKSSLFIVAYTENTAAKTANTIDADRYDAQKTSKDNIKLSSGCYDISFTNNWQDTGRTLMTVSVTVPDSVKATGLDVYYKMTTSFVNLFTNGLNQMNYVAFEDTTDGQSVPSYKDGQLNVIDKKYRGLFETFNGDLTAYAQGETHCIIPLIYEHGLGSVVKTEGVYKTSNETVGLNSDYSYYVTYAGSSSAHTKNLVIYDVIEKRINGMESEWYGTFDSVDLSMVKTLDSANPDDGVCSPVVYYCTSDVKTKEQFTTADFNVDNSQIWTTIMPADKSKITAVAIDCRKTNLQKDFVLAPQKKLSVNINMVSPAAAPRNDMIAYNEAYVLAMNQELLSDINEVTRTSVDLHFTPPAFAKESFPETGTSAKPAEVVKNSVIDYKLNVSNPDDTLSVYNIVVEDTLQQKLSINNKVQVSVGNEDPMDIDQSKRFNGYAITETNGITKFTATIKSLAPGESMTIIVPATVNANNDTEIMNTAYVTGYNGMVFEQEEYITSATTYHIVADIKARVKKVNSKGEGLAGAVLEVYDKNSTNWDSSTGQIKSGATPKTITIGGNNVTEFTSTTDVITFEIEPGDYILHEKTVPSSNYKKAADIPFTIDVEGLAHVNGELKSVVEMVDQPAYKIVFHENKPNGTDEEKQKVFKIFEPTDLENNKIKHFYDIPEWAGDEYVFAGWYCNDDCEYLTNISYSTTANVAKKPLNFETKTFTKANKDSAKGTPDYHLYAKWIPVGTVEKDNQDANLMANGYRGFGLAGVQIRVPNMWDSNYNNANGTGTMEGGMRFVTSLKESLLSDIDALSSQKVSTPEGNVDVEYGYAVGSENNIKAFSSHYGISDPTKYQLQYKGENVNGVNTTGETSTAETDYRYITNVNCTRGTTNENGTIKDDHRNFTNYRLYTLIVTYKNKNDEDMAKKVSARSYIRYYDANGKLRVFYNTYKKSMYSGCMCSYNQVADMAISQNLKLLEQQQTMNNN